MTYRIRTCVVLFCGLLFFPSVSHGDSLRCPETDRIIHDGDTFAEVLSICGEPQFRNESAVVLRRINQFESVAIPVEEWTYDFGPNKFIQFLRFEGGRLRRITHGSYGSSRVRERGARESRD